VSVLHRPTRAISIAIPLNQSVKNRLDLLWLEPIFRADSFGETGDLSPQLVSKLSILLTSFDSLLVPT
jgi:hypothetical protein